MKTGLMGEGSRAVKFFKRDRDGVIEVEGIAVDGSRNTWFIGGAHTVQGGFFPYHVFNTKSQFNLFRAKVFCAKTP